MSPSVIGGRHELGQNFLADRRVATKIAGLVPPGAVLELGPGAGALTRLLVDRPEPVTAVELDPRRAAQLRRSFGSRVRIVHADMLEFRLDEPHNVVSNAPFGVTTPLLRHLLGQRAWGSAVLLLQWEVARKRAAVGGTTLLTASWWPWYEFALAGRVPSAAFRPRPSVDGGLLVIRRRERPLVAPAQRAVYQKMVGAAFRNDRLPGGARPRDLDAAAWAGLFLGWAGDEDRTGDADRAARDAGAAAPRPPRRPRRRRAGR